MSNAAIIGCRTKRFWGVGAGEITHEMKGTGLEFAFRSVRSQQQLAAALNSFAPDIVLTDHRPPEVDAHFVLSSVREYSAEMPVIVVAGSVGEEAAAEVVRSGAAEFVSKQNLSRLGSAVLRALAQRRATAEVMVAQQRVASQREAVEAVYEIAAASRGATNEMLDRTVRSIAKVLRSPLVAVGRKVAGSFQAWSVYSQGEALRGIDLGAPLAGLNDVLFVEDRPEQCSDSLPVVGLDRPEVIRGHYHAYLGVPIKDQDGQTLAAVVVLDTAQRTYGEQDVRLVEIFTRYVANELERQRLQKELGKAREMEILGQITSGVAHEVRNPLNSLLALTEAMFMEMGDASEYAEFRELIEGSLNRLNQIMGDLLSLGRPVKAESLKPVSIPFLVESALQAWRGAGRGRSQRVGVDVPPEAREWEVLMDIVKMQEVLVNLLDNASHHVPPGTPIQLSVTAPRPGWVRMSVVDRGSGVPPEDLEKLFQPFYTTRRGGTGLGLSISQRIVRSHGGSIWITNNSPPPGATASVELPLAQKSAADHPPVSRPPRTP